MKLQILNKETQEPMLVLSQDDYGLSVVGGDPKLVQALKLNQFKDLKEIADYINSDPNGPYLAQPEGDEEQAPDQEQALDDRMKPALGIIKEMMSRVKSRQDQEKQQDESEKPEAHALSSFDAQIMLQPGGMIYVSYDGDNIGNAVARAERKDDEKELREMSNKINAGQELFKQWATQNGGDVVEQGGDEGLAKVPNAALKMVEEFRKQYEQTVGATCSIGIGKKISEATDARMLAKLKGKNRTDMFSETTRKELKIRLDEKGDAESKKIADALGTDSPTEEPQSVNQEPQAAPPQEQQQQQQPEEQPQQAGPEPDRAPQEQEPVNGQFSPELAKAMQEHLQKPEKPKSLRDSARHDQEIEDADYSYSEDADFAKRLRYVMKYGSRP